ncbi:MAG: amino acid ABC transporter substrate-binding protein [Clostridiales bacterium GWB2_37_7]|nr:MAG: amino acid ABC transporter substrate-binding protein [Clostridiales bacterium GWB2_37_7]
MKKRFKGALLVLVVLISIIVILTGCTGAAGSQATDNTKSTGFEKLQEIGYVTVGFDDTFVPMGFKNENGEIVGFDIDLAKEVFKRIGIEVKFQPIDWSMKETELNTGNIDLIWNGYTITDERKEKVAFTKPYLENRQIIITLADSDINSKANLKGKTVAAQNGSSSLDAINSEPELAATFKDGAPVLFDTNNEALMDLEAKRTDAVVADEILARYYIAERGQEKYKVLDQDFGKEEYGIGIRKEDTELLEKVNKALDEMRSDGTFAKISEQWFGANIEK